MRIAILSPIWYPVPPKGYGGTERVVSLLTDGLVERGHEVTLFASGDSHTDANLVSVYPSAPGERFENAVAELHHALSCYEQVGEFDLIHDHSGPLGAALGAATETPVVHTVHSSLEQEIGAIYRQLDRIVPSVGFVSLSMSQRKPLPELNWVGNCPNGLDFSRYSVRGRGERSDYLLFLGRLGYEKGCHRAIEVAREAGLPLKIAGKMQEPAERTYFELEIRPRLGGGIEWLEEVEETEKLSLLEHARALVFPIDWAEPFGLVMIEAMACGTPVIATRRGAVPEVIEHGRTGIIVESHREMVAALGDVDELDPVECRRAAEERFAPERIVADYEAVYRRTVSSQDAPAIGALTDQLKAGVRRVSLEGEDNAVLRSAVSTEEGGIDGE